MPAVIYLYTIELKVRQKEGREIPSSKNYRRNYKQEHKTAKRRGEVSSGPNGDNASRKRARYKLEKQGRVKKGDGKDVDHKNRNPKDNSSKNLRVQSKSKNRSFSRKK